MPSAVSEASTCPKTMCKNDLVGFWKSLGPSLPSFQVQVPCEKIQSLDAAPLTVGEYEDLEPLVLHSLRTVTWRVSTQYVLLKTLNPKLNPKPLTLN